MDDPQKKVVIELRKRARWLRYSAFAYTVVIIAAGAYLTTLIAKAPQETSSILIGTVTYPDSMVRPPDQPITIDVEADNISAATTENIVTEIISSILRFGVVIVPILIMFYVFSLVRYYLKLSALLHDRADALELSGGDANLLEHYLSIFDSSNLDINSNRNQIPSINLIDIQEKASRLEKIFKKFGIE